MALSEHSLNETFVQRCLFDGLCKTRFWFNQAKHLVGFVQKLRSLACKMPWRSWTAFSSGGWRHCASGVDNIGTTAATSPSRKLRTNSLWLSLAFTMREGSDGRRGCRWLGQFCTILTSPTRRTQFKTAHFQYLVSRQAGRSILKADTAWIKTHKANSRAERWQRHKVQANLVYEVMSLFLMLLTDEGGHSIAPKTTSANAGSARP